MATLPKKCNVLSDITNEYLKEQFMKKVNQETGITPYKLTEQCWDWTGYKNPSGHGEWQTDLCKELNILKAHRISMYLFRREEYLAKQEMDVLHSCDRGQCVNPAHLRMGTQTENNIDRDERGRQVAPSGVHNGSSIFTKEQIEEIIKLRSEGMIYSAIAERFKCNRRTIERMCVGTTYVNEVVNPVETPVRIYGKTIEQINHIWELKDSGVTHTKIAKETHTSTATLVKIFKEPRP